MSLFRTVEVPCPSCQVPVTFELVHSVNADRRASLRQEILDGTFQTEKCPSCSFSFRTDPEFTYLNLGRQQWIAAWPPARRTQWVEVEQHSRQAFETAFGAAAPPEAQALGKELRPRVVFGWAALVEKLKIQDAGIDDVTLELAKIALVRSLDDAPLLDNLELRLLGIEDGEKLLLGWFRVGSEDLTEVNAVPKELLAEIEAQAADWKELRDELTAGIFVDMQRLMIPVTAGATP